MHAAAPATNPDAQCSAQVLEAWVTLAAADTVMLVLPPPFGRILLDPRQAASVAARSEHGWPQGHPTKQPLSVITASVWDHTISE